MLVGNQSGFGLLWFRARFGLVWSTCNIRSMVRRDLIPFLVRFVIISGFSSIACSIRFVSTFRPMVSIWFGELSRDIKYDSIWFVFQLSTMFGSGLYGYPFVSGFGLC